MIIGIGLPRTGGRSLARALDMLGYSGSHHCELTGSTGRRHENETYFIDNSLYQNLDSVIENASKYILTYREPRSWERSISKWPKWDGPSMQRYMTESVEKFKILEIPLLVYDVTDGWEPLCNFLGEDTPEFPFPWVR